MIKYAPLKMSGAVRTLGEDTKLDENSVCGVGKRDSVQENRQLEIPIQEIQVTRNTDD